jgi:hypothetical protein
MLQIQSLLRTGLKVPLPGIITVFYFNLHSRIIWLWTVLAPGIVLMPALFMISFKINQ